MNDTKPVSDERLAQLLDSAKRLEIDEYVAVYTELQDFRASRHQEPVNEAAEQTRYLKDGPVLRLVRLRFFRDLVQSERVKVYEVFGIAKTDLPDPLTLGIEQQVFDQLFVRRAASILKEPGVKETLLALDRYHQMTDGWGDEVLGLKQHPAGDYVKWTDILTICQSFSPSTSGGEALPERDQSKPAEEQGLFRKFVVHRVDGSDAPGGKHHGCRYFVLDVDHDPHAVEALAAYANACEATHPELAKDLRVEWAVPVAPQPAPVVTDEWLEAEAIRRYPILETERTHVEVSASRGALRHGFKEGYLASLQKQESGEAFECPINQPGCTKDCGSYGCGN